VCLYDVCVCVCVCMYVCVYIYACVCVFNLFIYVRAWLCSHIQNSITESFLKPKVLETYPNESDKILPALSMVCFDYT